ncbi:hypothetical protein K474DRAFT_562259 [Panus rudis PR-1116 ss-1]|nr:hypothetical protein K474DRAFT_562259 [Panus rudis PR-1116 ss-1]
MHTPIIRVVIILNGADTREALGFNSLQYSLLLADKYLAPHISLASPHFRYILELWALWSCNLFVYYIVQMEFGFAIFCHIVLYCVIPRTSRSELRRQMIKSYQEGLNINRLSSEPRFGSGHPAAYRRGDTAISVKRRRNQICETNYVSNSDSIEQHKLDRVIHMLNNCWKILAASAT